MSNKNESSAKIEALKTRQLALKVIRGSLRGGSFDNQLKNTLEEGITKRDAAFIRELCNQYFRHLGSVRRVIRKMVTRPIPDKARSVSAILELGLIQILYMRTDNHAAVDQSVELVSRLKHPAEQAMKGMVNAVLRNVIREKDDILAFIARDPASDLAPWLKYSWEKFYGGKALESMGQAIGAAPPIDLSLKHQAEAASFAKSVNGFVLPTGSVRLKEASDITKLEGFDEGVFWVQDMAATLPASFFGDIKDKTVADVCAAPGGKTMQLAAMGAKVLAVDRSASRLKRLYENIVRTGFLDQVHVLEDDAASWSPENAIDHILLDAPCSATGTIRRNPDGQWLKGPKDVENLAVLQKEILEHNWQLLPIGGRLIYCVCSLQREEGQDQIEAFLSRHKDAELVPIRSRDVGGLNKLVTAEGYLLTRPDHLAKKGGMDGFFAARIDRVS